MPISTVSALSGYDLNRSLEAASIQESGTTKFAEIFKKADQSINEYAFGHIDAQDVVEALSTAEMALQTAISVRDRVVGAYQELLRMPL